MSESLVPTVEKQEIAAIVPPHRVHWFHDRNPRQDYGTESEQKENRESLAEYDWLATKGVHCQVMAEKDIVRCVTEREKTWNDLRNLAKSDSTGHTLRLLEIFEKLYTRNGIILPPNADGETPLEGITAYRRSVEFLNAQVLRIWPTTGDDKDKKSISRGIPVVVKSYATESDRFEEQVLENTSQSTAKKFSDAEMVAIGVRLVSCGFNKNKLRRLVGSSGQKAYEIARCAARFPDLKILERMKLLSNHDDAILFGPVDKGDVYKMLDDAGCTPEVVDAYFRKVSKKNRATAIASKSVIEQLSKESPDESIKTVCGAILEGKTDRLMAYLPVSKAVSLCHKVFQFNPALLPQVETYLESLLPAKPIATVTEQPATVTEQPATVTEQPATVTEQGDVALQPATEQPATVTEQPATVTEQGDVALQPATEQVATVTEQPATVTEQVATDKKNGKRRNR